MTNKEVKEIIWARGHEKIQAIHPTTLMFTKEKHLSETGDCIIAVAADRALMDLSPEFKKTIRESNSKIKIIIEAGEIVEEIIAYGSSKLEFTNKVDVVIRKSEFISDRTLAVRADKSSKDLSRELIDKLRNHRQKVKIILIASSSRVSDFDI